MSRWKFVIMDNLSKKLFPNFDPEHQTLYTAILAVVIFLGVAAIMIFPSLYVGAAIVGFLLLLFFARFPLAGLYLVVFLYPFINLVFVYKSLNIPYVDLAAMLVFAGWFIRYLTEWRRGERRPAFKDFPGIIFFLLFIISASLSLVVSDSFAASFKYLLRPLLFFYLMFVVLPYNVVKNKKDLFRVFGIFYAVGIIAALMGLWSLFFPGHTGLFRRAVPISIFGLWPLGYNQNLIAEVLVSIIPIGLYLFWSVKNELTKRWLFLGVLLMTFINFMTLSRTAWIATFLEFIILFLIKYRHYWRRVLLYSVAILLLMSPIIFYMYSLVTSSVASSSNYNRMFLTQISLDAWRKHPWIGNGAGVFQDLVSQEQFYILEFGAPLDSHGVIQKLLAESGALGLATFMLLLGYVLWRIVATYRRAVKTDFAASLVILVCFMTAVGSIVFQFFNTSYFVSKLWLPLGVALAATKFVRKTKEARD